MKLNSLRISAMSCTFMLGACAVMPPPPSQQLPLSNTLDAVKCNLAHFFGDAENIRNERYSIEKVSLKLTYITSLGITNSGSVGLTVPISSGSIGTSGEGEDQTTRGGTFVPTFEFPILTTKMPVLDAKGQPVLNPDGSEKTRPSTPSELSEQASIYAQNARSGEKSVCENAVDILFPEDLVAVTAADTGRRIDLSSVDSAKREATEIAIEAGGPNVRSVGLSDVLQAYRKEIGDIAAGYPLVRAGDYTIRSDFEVKTTTKAGVEITALIFSAGGTQSNTRANSLQVELVFDVTAGGPAFIIRPAASQE